MKMKRSSTLLALGLIGAWSAVAQTNTTTNTSTTTGTSTYSSGTTTPTTTTPSTTNSTMDNSSNTNSTMGTTTSGSTMDNSSTTGNNATYSSGTATPSTTGTSTYSTTTTTRSTEYGSSARDRRQADKPYKAVSFGIYGGLNTTRFEGENIENVENGNFTGRLGYQLGAYLRGGGRIFGQIGAEYFASSSNYFRSGDGSSLSSIQDRIDIKYIHVPAYVGIKLLQSDRGISALRLQGGVEFANRIGIGNNDFEYQRSDVAQATWNLLGNVGIDAGPLTIDLVYHHGVSDVLKEVENLKRRIWGLNVGFKF